MIASIPLSMEWPDVNKAVWHKSIREARAMLAALGLILFAFCWLRVWIVGLLPMQNFQTILDQFPQIEQFLPVSVSQLITYPGRIALTFEELIVVMGFALWCIARGSDVVSGELGRGTLEMVLAQPVSRRVFFWSKSLTSLLGLACLAGLCWAGIYVGIQLTTVPKPVPVVPLGPAAAFLIDPPYVRTPLANEVSAATFLYPTLNLFSLGVFLLGMTTLCSSFDRYRWRTIGVSSGIFAVAIVTKIVALADPRLSWLRWFTFLTAYEPQRVVQIAVKEPHHLWAWWLTDAATNQTQLGPLGMNALLIGSGVVALLIAAEWFARRDLPAPC